MPQKDVKIVLTAEVDKICAMTNPTESEVEVYCKLSDDNNGKGANVKVFKSHIYDGKTVEWSSRPGGKVQLLMIAINPGSPVIFKEGYILRPHANGKIYGNILLNASDLPECIYSIYFEVKNGPNSCGKHRIDPKLQANTQFDNGKS